MTEKQKAEMYRRRRAGQDLRSLGERYGLSGEWVRVLCERAGVFPAGTCRRCGERFERASATELPVCPACRSRHCVVCGGPFTRNQWAYDDSDTHKACRRESRGSKGGATYRSVETGVYRRMYKTTGVLLDGYYVNDGLRLVRHPTLHAAREARAARLAERAAKE